MVASLEKINGFIADTIYHAVLLCDAPGPTTCEQISEGLGLARAPEWIAHRCFDQVQHSDCGAAVVSDPISQVLQEFGMEDGGSLTFHSASLAAIHLRFRAWFLLAQLDASPPASVVHFVVIGAGARSR
jgi:hypothetical protein